MKNHLRIQGNPYNCNRKYLKTFFQTQNDSKYEMLQDISTPSSRMKFKTETENHKTHY